jgi:hypothetical protein
LACLLALVLAQAAVAAPAPLPRPVGRTSVRMKIELLDVNYVRASDQTFSILLSQTIRWKNAGVKDGSYDWADLWTPSITFVNAQDVTVLGRAMCDVDKGQVTAHRNLRLVLNTPFHMRHFPFDSAELRIYVLAGDDLALTTDPPATDTELLIDAEWAVGELRSAPAPHGTTAAWVLPATRNGRFYVWTFFLPLTAIVFCTWSLFWTLPPNLQVTMNGIIGLIAYRFAVGTSLPRLNYLSYADAYFLLCLGVVVLTHMAATRINVLCELKDHAALDRFRRRVRIAFPILFVVLNVALRVFHL